MPWNLGGRLDTDAPVSLGGNYDWGGMSKGTDWSGGFGVGKDEYKGPFLKTGENKGKALDLLKTFAGALSSSSQDKYREQGEESGSRIKFGPSTDTRGFGGQQLFDGFSVYAPPPAFSPFVIEGGGSYGKSTGQRIAGGLSGAASGALAGAPFGPVGMAVGAIGGGIGGAFG